MYFKYFFLVLRISFVFSIANEEKSIPNDFMAGNSNIELLESMKQNEPFIQTFKKGSNSSKITYFIAYFINLMPLVLAQFQAPMN